MTQSTDNLPPIGAILTGPHWPDRVRVVRVEPRGTSRVLIEAVTLDGQDRLISRLLRREDMAGLVVETRTDQPTLSSDPAGFRLAAEATRIRLAYTYDPQFAVSLARAGRWDLVVFDEAHKLAAYRRGSKLTRTRRYRLARTPTSTGG